MRHSHNIEKIFGKEKKAIILYSQQQRFMMFKTIFTLQQKERSFISIVYTIEKRYLKQKKICQKMDNRTEIYICERQKQNKMKTKQTTE